MRICFPELEGTGNKKAYFEGGRDSSRVGGGRRCLNSGTFIKACFPCLNLLVPVSVTVFITQPQCANKPHMFRFSPYLLRQDKVEMSVLAEIRDRIHKHTQWQRVGTCLTHLCFLQNNIRLTQRRHSIKVS